MFGKFNKLIGLVAVIIVIAAIGFSLKSNQETNRLKQELESLQQTQQQPSDDEVNKLVAEIGKLIVLPEGENPTLATITDKEKLKDVPFFSKAENGDKVLIYVTARKAYLFRPSTQKIIEVATLNLNTATQDFTGKLALRNGTATAGLTTRFEEVLKQGLPKIEVTSRDNAKKTTYIDSLVIDLTGSRGSDAQKLATTIGGKVATLPADETKPEGAEFLIIIGAGKASPSPATSPTTGGASASPSPTPSPSPQQ